MLKNNFFGEKDKADVRNYVSGQKKMTETCYTLQKRKQLNESHC